MPGRKRRRAERSSESEATVGEEAEHHPIAEQINIKYNIDSRDQEFLQQMARKPGNQPDPPDRNKLPRLHKVALETGNDDILLYSAGALTKTCNFCGALSFIKESISQCCTRGIIDLPQIRCPESVRALYVSDNHISREFREKIQRLNNLFAMASIKTDRSITQPAFLVPGNPCYAVKGELFHYTCSIPRGIIDEPIFNLYYMVSEEAAVARRKAFFATDRPHRSGELIKVLERIMRTYNPFVIYFQQRAQGNLVVDTPNTQLLHETLNTLPIIRGGARRRLRNDVELKNLCPLSDPLAFPLLFPCGDMGFSVGLEKTNNTGKATITMRQFYRYRIQIRREFSTLHFAGFLFQVYLVDAWCRTENNDLWYQRKKSVVNGCRSALERYNRRSRIPVTKYVLLPATFSGSRRNKHLSFLQTLATIMQCGRKPDLFITFTCNPRWTEIIQNLNRNQNYADRPDLVCRVFKIKLDEFMDDITHKLIFGQYLNYFYTIEFQKRGLPHAHILITLENQPVRRKDINRLISARVPKQTHPRLYDAVATFQIHQCDVRCLDDNEINCSKHYPQNYCDSTTVEPNSTYVTYKRPNDGLTVTRGDLVFDNRNVVPYNPYVLLKYQTHMNIEIPRSLDTVRYLYKYVKPFLNVRPHETEVDEIKEYQRNRTVTAYESVWRLLEYKIQDRSHSVEVLPVHGDTGPRKDSESKLLGWFSLNKRDPEATLLRYLDIPEYYSWQKLSRDTPYKWVRRTRKYKIIGTVENVDPHPGTDQVERFYLRVLLLNVKGAVSYRDLLKPGGRPCASFEKACERLGLLNTDKEYDTCLREYALRHESKSLLSIFINVCCLLANRGKVQTIQDLWMKYRDHLIQVCIANHSIRDARFLLAQRIRDTVRRVQPALDVDD